MGRPKRHRRTLALRVSEARSGEALDALSAGQRFASGWAFFCVHGQFGNERLSTSGGTDPVFTAGFLAAKAAWDAHHFAVNWIDIEAAR